MSYEIYIERFSKTRMICTAHGQSEEHRGACIADKGGAMILNGTDIGIHSFDDHCGSASIPDVFTKVSDYVITVPLYII